MRAEDDITGGNGRLLDELMLQVGFDTNQESLIVWSKSLSLNESCTRSKGRTPSAQELRFLRLQGGPKKVFLN